MINWISGRNQLLHEGQVSAFLENPEIPTTFLPLAQRRRRRSSATHGLLQYPSQIVERPQADGIDTQEHEKQRPYRASPVTVGQPSIVFPHKAGLDTQPTGWAFPIRAIVMPGGIEEHEWNPPQVARRDPFEGVFTPPGIHDPLIQSWLIVGFGLCHLDTTELLLHFGVRGAGAAWLEHVCDLRGTGPALQRILQGRQVHCVLSRYRSRTSVWTSGSLGASAPSGGSSRNLRSMRRFSAVRPVSRVAGRVYPYPLVLRMG